MADTRIKLPVWMDEAANYIYDADGHMLFQIRGWGHLTGAGGLSLPADEAEAVQRARGQAVVNALNSQEAVRVQELPAQSESNWAAANVPDLVCACERCQMKLPEHLGTYTPGIRGSMAWRCAACLPIEGTSGRLLREEVVRQRKLRLAILRAEGER